MLGLGLIKGLAITLKNMVGSYYDPKRMTTVEYPEKRLPIGENYRSFPFLVYDGEDAMAGLRCTACQICEKECPPQCIYIEKSKDKKPDAFGKAQLYPAVFNIDTAVCMSCGICVEVCPFQSIKMDKVFEVATKSRYQELVLTKEKLAKSNQYFNEIRPTDAAAVDAERAATLEKAKAAAAAAAAKAKAAAEAKVAAPATPPAGTTATPPVPPAAG